MDYFRQRWKSIVVGFLVGVIVGWFQPDLVGKPIDGRNARLFLSLQMGAAFTVVSLFALNYLEVRRRAYAKIMADSQKKSSEGS